MVGNLNKKCQHQHCKKIITHGNTKRHNDRWHADLSTPLELRSTLSEVLESCNIPQELWPAERKVLDRLLNYRLLQDRTTSFDMPGEPRLQIFDDDHLRHALPSLEEVVVQMAAAIGCGCARTGRFTKNLGEFWIDGKHNPSPRTEDVLLWLSRVPQSHDDVHTMKILNLSPQAALPPSRIDLYFEARNLFLQKLGINTRPENIMTEVNITPASSDVPIHHDEDLIVSTARAIASHTRPAVERSIAKIWIVWPPGHTHKFSLGGSRTSYGDTTHSLHNAEGAVWFAQKEGETVVLPKDLAHSTFTLLSCYLLTSSCPGVSLARVPLISSDIAAGTTESYAVTRLVDTVEAALERPFDDSLRLIRNFWSESAYNLPSLRHDKTGYSRLVKLLANHMRRERRCISCVVIGRGLSCKEVSDYRRHIEWHMKNGISEVGDGRIASKMRPLRASRRISTQRLKKKAPN